MENGAKIFAVLAATILVLLASCIHVHVHVHESFSIDTNGSKTIQLNKIHNEDTKHSGQPPGVPSIRIED